MERQRFSGLNGGAEGNRTPDLVIANDALYQLSYSPASHHPREPLGVRVCALAGRASQPKLPLAAVAMRP